MLNLVRCPHCGDLSEIEPRSAGQYVACPFCGKAFKAEAIAVTAPKPAAEPPLVYPARDRIEWAEPEDDLATEDLPDSTGLLYASALLPIFIPIGWVFGLFVLKAIPIFSFALPMAMTVGLCGVNLGIIFASIWSVGTRIKSVLAVGLVGLFVAASLFFVKKEWAIDFKNQFAPGNLNWQEYQPADRAYRVRLPGRAIETQSPLPEWQLKAVRTAIDDRRARGLLGVIYIAAHGQSLKDLQGLSEEECFKYVLTLLQQSGEVAAEKSLQIPDPANNREHPGREWVFALPDGVTNRIVRVYRVRHRGEDLFFYLAVEGAFVSAEAKYVQDFMKAFALRPLPRR